MTEAWRIPVRVYWEDTDAGGVVYHASYVRFLERGRTELLRTLGISQSLLQAEGGVLFVVRHMELSFERPAVLDDLLDVETAVAKMGGASLTLTQRVLRGEEVLLAATVVVVCIRDGRPVRIPAAVRQALPG